MEEIEKLKDKINYLDELINRYQQQLLKERCNYILFFESERTRQLEEKIYKLRREVYKIEQVIEISNKEPVISGKSVDLYKDNKSPKGYYTVCLRGTKTIIGEVGCNNENNNVHYKIDDEYQNNGYGFQALVTMVNYLVLNNIENIDIIIRKTNTTSIKLAEKLGITFPNFNKEETEQFIIYHFNLNKRIEIKHNTN